jgi:hemerythrin superfamily protein
MAGKESNAIELLKHDHREVESMFKQFDAEDESRSKAEIAQHICLSLIVHSEIEEELFYPAAQRALDDEDRDLISEAKVEHMSLKRLIDDIGGSGPSDEMFEARMTVLKEYVKHHVHEEEHELMPQVKKSDLDLEALGSRLLERKQALIQEYRSYAEQQSGTSVNLPPLAIASRSHHKSGSGGKHATHARVHAPSRTR